MGTFCAAIPIELRRTRPCCRICGHHVLCRIDADGKGEALRAQNGRSVHSDDPAVGVQQWSSGIAGIERRVRLDDLFHHAA